MRGMNLLATCLLSSIALYLGASPQGGLGKQLHGIYLETTMDPSGIKVIKPGSTLVIQIDGVQANPMKKKLEPFENTFEDGQIKATEKKGIGRMFRAQAKIAWHGEGSERPIASGAKVYLLNLEYLPANDSVDLTVQTCGDCDPKAVDPTNVPYRAKVSFKFVHGALAVTDANHVQQAIEQVFKLADAGGGGEGGAVSAPAPQAAPQPQPPPPQEQFAPIAPPPPPPTEQKPRMLKTGMTIDEVKSTFGEPDSVVEAGQGKVIYMYKDKKITFTNGKVSDVDVQ